ncbi:hypothetical protein DLAC_03082 [Tieghemostelium lacteum]|uniref:SET domain-containing protein n=1 Tax=Tieghemostelium lacteum TaxID=361077 RepID=A0A152A2A3_TIELA|nr:hypothetical protein DLAC_03082 [Tieghemostelium lacteum]|eukprot:KYR00339.1 hypothetical protein DLAC_03082 [Tieghemostelium lacteum]
MSDFKNQANILYTKGQFKDAKELYIKGIEEIKIGDKELSSADKELVSVLYCNLAVTNIQLKEYTQALNDATLSIEYNNQNAKSYQRAGDALIHLQLYREAKEMYLHAIRHVKDENSLQIANNSLQNSKMKLFYEPILQGTPKFYENIEIRYLDTVKEKSLFTKRDVKKGDILFMDTPFIHRISPDSMKRLGNLICHFCMKFIAAESIVYCKGPCKSTQYCSDHCRNESEKTVHTSRSCVDPNDKQSALVQYRNMVENLSTGTTLLLAESIYSMISHKLITRQSKNCNLALGTITHLKRGPLMAQQPSYNGNNLSDLQKQYQPLLELLKKTYYPTDPKDLENKLLMDEMNKLFSVDFYDNILGMINFNSTSTVVKSPTKTNSNNSSKNDSWGIGLFPIFSCMNHSCLPNVDITNEIEDGVNSVKMVLKAKKNLLEGTEILHSYCDEKLPKKSRQSILSQYGFKCSCSKCSSGLIASTRLKQC